MVLAVTKVLHEFGHGLSCKHFGGECHEMGVMILVLTPCLYCNVSDSWMLPSKWRRAAIGAAGMYVELVIASICTYVWWFSQPGLLNNLCLNAMFVCSVSTVIFNANPLLRYDGYYILADLTEIPNLRQKATSILSRKLGEWCMGLEPPEDPFLPQRNQAFFAVYSVASAIYRWFVVFSILWFLYKIFQPYHLEVIGQIMVLASLWGLLVMPLYQVGKFLYVPGRLDKVKKTRMFATLAVVVALVAAALFVPLPHSVMSILEVQAYKAEPVYVDVPNGGVLDKVYVEAGQRVKKGQRLAQLRNLDIELAIAKLVGQEKDYEAQLENLRREGLHDPRASTRIPVVEKAMKAVADELAQKRRDRGAPAACGPDRRHGSAAAGNHRARGPGRPIALLVRHAPGACKPRRLSEGERHVLPDRRPAKARRGPRDRPERHRIHPHRAERSTSSSTRCRTPRCTAALKRLPAPT